MKNIFGLIITFCILLSFQNCGRDLTPLQSSVEMSSLLELQTAVDSEALPRLLNDEKLVFTEKNQTMTLFKNPLLADANSVVGAFDRQVVNSTTTTYLYSLNSGVSSEESSIAVKGNKIIATHITDASNYSFIEAEIPADAGRIITVAVSFGVETNNIVVLINGKKINTVPQKIGNPLAFSYLEKSIQTYVIERKTIEVLVYKKALAALDLNVLSRYVAGTSQVKNVIYDPNLSAPSIQLPVVLQPTPQFLKAKAIIDAKCISCHSDSAKGDYRNLTQAQFLQKGLVIPKNLADSKLYYRLNGALAGPGPKSMPQGTALPASEVTDIANWINSIQ